MALTDVADDVQLNLMCKTVDNILKKGVIDAGGTVGPSLSTTPVVVVTDTDGRIASSVITETELNTLDGISTGTSLYTQLGLKAPLASPAFTGNASFTSAITNADNVGAVSYTHLTLPTKRIV